MSNIIRIKVKNCDNDAELYADLDIELIDRLKSQHNVNAVAEVAEILYSRLKKGTE